MATDPLKLDSYTISNGQALGPVWQFMDKDGNKLIDVNSGAGGISLVDNNNNVIGKIRKVGLGPVSSFELFDGANNSLGRVSVKAIASFGMLHNFVLDDGKGNAVALVNVNEDLSYSITSPNGKTTMASLAKKPMEGGILKVLAQTYRNKLTFVLQIKNKSFPNITLIELAVAICQIDGSAATGVRATHPI